MISEETLRNIRHVTWWWPDAIHSRRELSVLEPGRRYYDPDETCPCGCGTKASET